MFSSNASCIHIDGINVTVEKIWHSAFIFLTAIYMLAKILIVKYPNATTVTFMWEGELEEYILQKLLKNQKKMQKTKHTRNPNANKVYNQINYVLIN